MGKAVFRARRVNRVIVITLGFVLLAAGLTAAAAETAPGPTAAISSPAHSAVITGNTATVTVLFDAGTGAKVTAAELYVDGELHNSVPVSPPLASGSCKLSWRCGDFDAGQHVLTARVYDSTGHSRAVDVEVLLQAAPKENGADRVKVEIIAPADGQEIAGLANVRIATDESRVRYVMLLIDDVFVALTNMPPFTFSLNTVRYLNGQHTLRATAFDFSDTPNDSPSITVVINNPGGRTEMRAPAQAAPTIEPKATAAPPAQPAATSKPVESPAGASPPQAVSADSEPVRGVVGSPSAPSLTTPRGDIKPAAAAVKPAAPPAPATVKPAPVAPRPAETATAPPATAPGQSTAAASAVQTAMTEGAVDVTSKPEAAAPRGALPKGAVQIAVAPPVAAAPQPEWKPLGSAIATAAPEVRAMTATEAVVDAPAVALMASGLPALPKVRVERPRPAPARMAAAPVVAPPAPVTPPIPSTATAPVQVAALAPEMTKGGNTAPASAIAATPKSAAPVLLARAPSTPSAITAVVTGRGEVIVHAVQPGEQLATIAARYGVPAQVVARFNNLPVSADLTAGETVRIPWQSALVLNGEPVYTDVPVMSEGGISMAPFRAIVEHSGGSIWWLPANKQVRAKAFAHDIWVTIGSRLALVDANQYTLETEAKMLRERAMVPLGLFRDALGFKVTFDQATGRIYMAAR